MVELWYFLLRSLFDSAQDNLLAEEFVVPISCLLQALPTTGFRARQCAGAHDHYHPFIVSRSVSRHLTLRGVALLCLVSLQYLPTFPTCTSSSMNQLRPSAKGKPSRCPAPSILCTHPPHVRAGFFVDKKNKTLRPFTDNWGLKKIVKTKRPWAIISSVIPDPL